jgi:hypothetical protein
MKIPPVVTEFFREQTGWLTEMTKPRVVFRKSANAPVNETPKQDFVAFMIVSVLIKFIQLVKWNHKFVLKCVINIWNNWEPKLANDALRISSMWNALSMRDPSRSVSMNHLSTYNCRCLRRYSPQYYGDLPIMCLTTAVHLFGTSVIIFHSNSPQ